MAYEAIRFLTDIVEEDPARVSLWFNILGHHFSAQQGYLVSLDYKYDGGKDGLFSKYKVATLEARRE